MAGLRVLLLIPPLTQLNTPYPSTAYLTGFLRARGIDCWQADIGIEMVLRLFCREGLQRAFDQIRCIREKIPAEAQRMLAVERAYVEWIDPVIEFLQGRHPALAQHLVRRGVLPEGPRFANRMPFLRPFSREDEAKQRATWFLEDLADLVHATVSPHFAISRYAEHLARSASSFTPIETALTEPPSFTDHLALEALRERLDQVNPTFVGITVPFPGNVFGAFRIAQAIKRLRPGIPIALGGGYANTELRRLTDPRVFDYVDFITLDDGERPLLSLVEHQEGLRPAAALCRTFYRQGERVLFAHDRASQDFPMGELGCPTYDGLPLDRYLTILDSANPMHRLWSEGHWNKLTVAHGCYWKQCTFCDVSLNYIRRYEITPTERLIGQIERLVAETGRRGFHFVDEAAPPAALKALALTLLERGLTISWWGNVRFEAAFTPDLCRLLAASGCIAVTAGLEAASDRLLEKIKKGITVDQTALVAAAFHDAGILVHAYLMYGCPSQTVQETIDSLERVRQLMAADLVQSAFWHRFTVTAHSPVGLDPGRYGLRILGPAFEGFAENDLIHRDRRSNVPTWLGEGLRRSMWNYLEGRGLKMDVRRWFDRSVPKPRVSPSWVYEILARRCKEDDTSTERHFVWLGGSPTCVAAGRRARLTCPGRTHHATLLLPREQGEWLTDLLLHAAPHNRSSATYPTLRERGSAFPGGASDFDEFLKSPSWKKIRTAGLLLV